MTHPIVSTEATHECESDYRARTRKSTLIAALIVTIAFVVLIVYALFNASPANAATSPQGLPAATLAAEPETVYPGGDPGGELSAALQQVAPLLGSLGSLGNQPSTPQPPQGDLPLLDDPAMIYPYCDGERADIRFAGVAPLTGRYVITLWFSKDVQTIVFDDYLEKGQKLHKLVKDTPQGTKVMVTLELPAEPDDTATSGFSETIEVSTPICR